MAQNGIFLNMEAERRRDVPKLVALMAVRCLECGEEYSKPERGGTVRENPGCPRCGYLGWISASIPVTPLGSGPLHFDEDPLPRRAAPAR